MGNRPSLWRHDADEENNFTMSLASAASRGAREAVTDAVQKARHGGELRGDEIAPVGSLIAVLLLDAAQDAAVDGAKQAIDDVARENNLSTCVACALKDVKFAAGCGAKEGLKAD